MDLKERYFGAGFKPDYIGGFDIVEVDEPFEDYLGNLDEILGGVEFSEYNGAYEDNYRNNETYIVNEMANEINDKIGGSNNHKIVIVGIDVDLDSDESLKNMLEDIKKIKGSADNITTDAGTTDIIGAIEDNASNSIEDILVDYSGSTDDIDDTTTDDTTIDITNYIEQM